jgi:hypothetical protein
MSLWLTFYSIGGPTMSNTFQYLKEEVEVIEVLLDEGQEETALIECAVIWTSYLTQPDILVHVK